MADDTGRLAFEAGELLEALEHAVVATDLDGVVAYWNTAAERLYGWTAEEATGRNVGAVTVPDAPREVADEITASLRAGVPWSGGFLACRKDGSSFPALVTDSGVYRDGELVGIVGVSTNLGWALQPLLERSTDAALILRSDAVVTYASPAVHQVFGWPDTVVGTSVVPLLHPDDRTALADLLDAVVASPGARPPVEVRVLVDGDWLWTDIALTNVLDDPVVRGVVCNLRLNLRRAALESAQAHAEQLSTALQTRVVIEQAKGFLACRDGISPDEAFTKLHRYARGHNLAVRDVSRRLVDGSLRLPAQRRS